MQFKFPHKTIDGLGFDRDYLGASGIAAALLSLLHGETTRETLVLADHPRVGSSVYRVLSIGLSRLEDGVLRVRECGEGLDPEGVGSHTLCVLADEPERTLTAAADLAMRMAAPVENMRHALVFRENPEG